MTNLAKKKALAAKTLKIGKNRIHFNNDNFAELKEAITKQDIKELHAEGIITIKPVKGRKTIKRRKTKRGPGKIKKTVKHRKQTYVKITRKLRSYLKELKKLEVINTELYIELRKKIRMRAFRSKSHLKEHLENTEKIDLIKTIQEKQKKLKVKKPTSKSKKSSSEDEKKGREKDIDKKTQTKKTKEKKQ